MSTYMDLIDRISKDTGTPCGNIRLGMHEALDWLDQNPDQLPGRTIAASELEAALDATYTEERNAFGNGAVLLARYGITVVPDPEPTNAEKLAALLVRTYPSFSSHVAGELAEALIARGVTVGDES